MVGIRPVADALGRVNKLEVIPLEELGRPRVDVVVNCSGVFRDLFVNQVCYACVCMSLACVVLPQLRVCVAYLVKARCVLAQVLYSSFLRIMCDAVLPRTCLNNFSAPYQHTHTLLYRCCCWTAPSSWLQSRTSPTR